jgi:hypothetical protein
MGIVKLTPNWDGLGCSGIHGEGGRDRNIWSSRHRASENQNPTVEGGGATRSLPNLRQSGMVGDVVGYPGRGGDRVSGHRDIGASENQTQYAAPICQSSAAGQLQLARRAKQTCSAFAATLLMSLHILSVT